jgi:hypothetical protein
MTIKKNTSAVHVVNLAQYEKPTISEKRADEYVQYGNNNNYYDFLIEAYKNSTTNNAVINGIIRLIYGKGLTALDAAKKPNEYAQFMTIFAPDEVRKICSDLKMLGQCAVQVLYENKRVVKVVHTPIQLLCPEKCDKEGEINNYWYSDNWSNIREYKPVSIPVFGSGADREIMVIKPYSVGMKYFANVDYQGGLPYATLEEEIADYLINETQNSFSGTKVVNVNSGKYTEIQQKEISEKITAKLTGAKGKKVIVSFNDNVEASTTVEDISLNDAPKHYEYLATESRDKLLLSHNVTSPLLFGIITGTGFSSNSDELKSSLSIFDNTVIRTFQELLIDSFDRILAVNEIALKLTFKPLQVFEAGGVIGSNQDDSKKIIEGINSLSPLVANKVLESMTANEIRALVGLHPEVGGGDLNEQTVLSSSKTPLQTILDDCEDANQEGWIVLDERDVELEDEDVLNDHINSLNEEIETKLTKLSIVDKFINLVSTGTARPTAISSQDKLVKEKYFKVRYRYTGNPSPDRDFCNSMLSANKLYRKEDIDRMSNTVVNAGFGEFGADTYDIFKFKGGARCHHKFERVTMMLDLNSDSEKFEQIGTRAAEIKGFKITNPYQVSVYPDNLPLKGFSPRNKNLPNDIK